MFVLIFTKLSKIVASAFTATVTTIPLTKVKWYEIVDAKSLYEK